MLVSSRYYNEKSPRTASVVLLYCNLVINITYGVIYTLLNKILFPDAATNIAISLAFTETVILYFAIMTVRSKKYFMLTWVTFVILLNSSFVIITILIHLFSIGYCNSVKYWRQYISKKICELVSHFPDILRNEWEDFLLLYLPPVVAGFVFATFFFKFYSVWAIDRHELKSRLVQSIKSLLCGCKKLKKCERVAAQVP